MTTRKHYWPRSSTRLAGDQAQHRSPHRRPQGLFIENTALKNFDLIWPMGFGPRQGFLDWLQLLDELPERVITAPASMIPGMARPRGWPLRKSHRVGTRNVDGSHGKESGDWVLKPLAGSFVKTSRACAATTQIR